MIYVRGQVPKKEIIKIQCLVEEIFDSYREFYITKDRLRLFIKENLHLLFDNLEHGDKIIYDENLGIIFVTGWSDKSFPRKYIKILAKDNNSADKLIKVLLWNFSNLDLYCKIKKGNPVKDILMKNGFRFKGDRGQEILLCKRAKIAINSNKE